MKRMKAEEVHKRYPVGNETEISKRMQTYGENVTHLLMAYDRYGTMVFRGRPNEELQEMAINAIMDIQQFLGSGRIPITDHFAVVVDYYVRFDYRKGDRTPIERRPTELVYTVGFELVMRDFRNYTAIMNMTDKDEFRHYLRTAVNVQDPLMRPGAMYRTFDVPMGMIHAAEFIPSTGLVRLKLRGISGEYYEVSFEPGAIEPIIGGLYSEHGKEFGLDFGDMDSVVFDDPLYTDNNIQESDDNE